MKHSLKKTTSVSDLRLSVRLVTVTCREKKKTQKKHRKEQFKKKHLKKWKDKIFLIWVSLFLSL